MNVLHLFAGIGGGILAGELLGQDCLCAVEIEPYCQEVLLQRQRDGILSRFPIWGDIRTFNGKPWRGIIQEIAGGFPCTDVSLARNNRNESGGIRGLSGESSGLWHEMERVIEEVQPGSVLIENSPNLRTNGLVQILQSINRMGYHARWGVFKCSNFGADHHRKRLFIFAYTDRAQCKRSGVSYRIPTKHVDFSRAYWWKGESGLERVSHWTPYQVERLTAIGNAQSPIVAAFARSVLSSGTGH